MSAVSSVESNATTLSLALEDPNNPGQLPGGGATWTALEPNSYDDFGADYSLISRRPINASRQKRKGVVVDRDASGGFQTDVTTRNLDKFIEGVFMANYHVHNALAVATVDTDGFAPASGGAAYVAGDIAIGAGFANAANNGPKLVTASDATSIEFAGAVAESGATNGKVTKGGFRFASGDAVINVSGTYPRLTTTAKNCTTFGFIVGEWVYVGGDATDTFFGTCPAFYGRVRAVASGYVEFDKTSIPLVADSGSAKTVEIYFGRVLMNEQAANIKRHTYQFERTLGKADTTDTYEQAEYLTYSMFNEFTLTMNTADKVTADVSILASQHETRNGSVGPKAGTRVTGVEGDAINTTSHINQIALRRASAPNVSLYAYVTDASLTVNNNITPNKAISVLGAFGMTLGVFEVGAQLTAYFADVDAQSAIKNNDNMTFHVIMSRSNSGLIWDVPLLALGGGRLEVSIDEPITLPLTIDAGRSQDLGVSDYTLLLNTFDYLPNRAMAQAATF